MLGINSFLLINFSTWARKAGKSGNIFPRVHFSYIAKLANFGNSPDIQR